MDQSTKFWLKYLQWLWELSLLSKVKQSSDMKYEFSNVVNHKAHQGKMTKTKDQTHQEHMLNGTLWVFC